MYCVYCVRLYKNERCTVCGASLQLRWALVPARQRVSGALEVELYH
jgi:hypothetical protein